MVVSQAALIKPNNPNLLSGSNKATVSGKIISISNGVLSVDVGGEIINLLPEDGNYKEGELIKFLITDGGTKAQIFNDINLPISDSLSISIDSDIKELLTLLDFTINNIKDDKSELKKSLQQLFQIVKNDVSNNSSLSKVVNVVNDNFQVEASNLKSMTKRSVEQIISKLESIKNLGTSSVNNSNTFISSNGIKELVADIHSLNKEQIFIYKNLNDLIKRFDESNEALINLTKTNKVEGGVAHLIPQGNGKAELQLLDSRDLNAAFKYLTHNQFDSPFLKSQFSNEIFSILKQKESVSVESLKILDSIFVKNPDLAKSDLSTLNKTNIVSQIISLIDSVGKEKLPLIEKLIPQMINSFKNDLETLFATLKGDDFASIEKILLTINNSLQKEDKKDFMSLLFNLIGINRESNFTKDNLIRDQFLKSEQNSIKEVLLKILNEEGSGHHSSKENGIIKENGPGLSKSFESPEIKEPGVNYKNKQVNEFKNKIEQVVNKIEALQVLAKKSTTLGVDSQLISVPLNINNEWAELRVQFSKKREDEKNKKRKNKTTVQMSIELSVIGEVSAEMDFSSNKDLSINLILAHRPTIEWFEGRKSDILSALEKYDFKSIQLNIKLIKDTESDVKHFKNIVDRLDISA